MILIDKRHNRYKLDHHLTSKDKRKKTGGAWIPGVCLKTDRLVPKPETRNPEPETRNPKTRNPKLETRNPKP